jgi:hypothetical protein
MEFMFKYNEIHGAEMPTRAEPHKKFSTVYGTPMFLTVFTRAHHWSLS